MKTRGWLVAVVVLSGCLDFEKALTRCEEDGGGCAVEALDAGGRYVGPDAGVLYDAGVGRADAGALGADDAGNAADAGTTGADAGTTTTDAGTTTFDAGTISTDAGTPTSGDAGVLQCSGGCVSESRCLPIGAQADNACGVSGSCMPCSGATPFCGSAGTCIAPPTWSQVYTSRTADAITGIWATGPGNAWFAGNRTGFVHAVGGRFDDGYLIDTNATGLVAVGPPGKSRVFISGSFAATGRMTSFTEPWDGGEAPEGLPQKFDSVVSLQAVFQAGTSLYSAGSDANHHLAVFVADGGGWTPVSPGDGGAPNAGWGSSPTNYYIVTDTPALMHFSNGAVTTIPLPKTAYSVWGTSPTKVWVVGVDFVATIENDRAPTELVTGLFSATWGSVWAVNDSNVFFVGSDSACTGRIVRYDGTRFRSYPCLGTTNAMLSIHGAAVDDVWAGDMGGGIYHLNP